MDQDRLTAPGRPAAQQSPYDVVIVGGSFAGLATALALRGHRVLIVDQRPIGAHQTSTCGTPLAAAQAVGAESAILEVHDALVLHTGRHTFAYPPGRPFVTFDYPAFCQAMLAQTDAEVWCARATAVGDTEVATTQGTVRARFVVDASGWQGLHARAAGPARARGGLGYGVETELPGAAPGGPNLHFYFDRALIREGYAWVFPCGQFFRIGVCTFDPAVRLGPVLDRHLARFGLRPGRTHGGVLATAPAPPIVGSHFVVGDAAGQCLPLTAEGIRAALDSGRQCGELVAAALAGEISAEDARAHYAAAIHAERRKRQALLRTQRLVATAPDGFRATAGRIAAPSVIVRRMMAWYFAAAGGAARATAGPPRDRAAAASPLAAVPNGK